MQDSVGPFTDILRNESHFRRRATNRNAVAGLACMQRLSSTANPKARSPQNSGA